MNAGSAASPDTGDPRVAGMCAGSWKRLAGLISRSADFDARGFSPAPMGNEGSCAPECIDQEESLHEDRPHIDENGTIVVTSMNQMKWMIDADAVKLDLSRVKGNVAIRR
jgi:hypothetical protein